MASLVGAVGMSHILASRSLAQEQAERVFAGLRETGELASGQQADVILFVICDHMANFGTDLEAPFTVGVADHYTSLGDMDLPRMPVTGAPEFARALVTSVSQEGFDLAVTTVIRPDHGLMIPRLFVDPAGQTPIVPLNINMNMSPLPTPQRCWNLGRAIGKFIARRPQGERVAIVATGGLSHWIMRPEMGRVNAAFDLKCLEAIAAGDAISLSNLSAEEIERESGNGGLELVTWLCMAGAAYPAGGRVVFYEPMEAWLTGLGGVVMHVGDKQ